MKSNFPLHRILLAFPLLHSPLIAADFHWTGLSGFGNFLGDSTNWDGNPDLFNGHADLIFSGTLRTSPSVNVQDYHINTIRFTSTSSFSLSGLPLTLQTSVSVTPFIRNESSGVSHSISAPIRFNNGALVHAQNGNLTLGGVSNVGGPANNLTLQANAGRVLTVGAISGFNNLIKTNPGVAQLNGAITGIGAIDLANGTLFLLADNVLPAGTPLAMTAGTTLNVNGFSNSIGSLSGTGSINLGILPGGSLTVNQSAHASFSGTISGPGSFTKAGEANLSLSAVMSHTGATHINAGTLTANANTILSSGGALNIGASGTLNLTGTNQVAGSLAGSGVINLTSAILAAGSSNASTVWSGNLTGPGEFRKMGTGTLEVTTAQSLTGPIAIAGGTWFASHSNALGSTNQGTTVGNNATLRLDAGVTLPAGETITISGSGFAGGGAIRAERSSGTGHATVLGNITLAADSTITNANPTDSSLLLGNPVIFGTISIPASRTLTLNGSSSGAFIVHHRLTGNGSLVCDYNSPLSIQGDNTFTGSVQVARSTVFLGHDNALGGGTNPVTVANGAILSVPSGVHINTARPLHLAGQLHASGTGTAWSGSGDIVLDIGSSIQSTNAPFTIHGPGKITGDFLTVTTPFAAGTLTIAREVELDGGMQLSKTGPGTLEIAAPCIYSGSTNVLGGTLRTTASEVLPDVSPVVISAGTLLHIGATSETVASLSGTGTVQIDATLKLQPAEAVVFNGTITATHPNSGFVEILAGPGGQTFASANSYHRSTIIRQNGKLTVTANGALSPTDELNILNNGLFRTSAPRTVVGSLSVIGGQVEFFGSSPILEFGGDNTIDTNIAGSITGPGSLEKTGTGATSFSGSPPAHTGTTTVKAGRLNFNNGIPNSPVTVDAGAEVRAQGLVDDFDVSGTLMPVTNFSNPTVALTAQNVMFRAGSRLTWAVADWNGTPANGMAVIDCSGLHFQGTPANKVNIRVWLSTGLANFSETPRVFKLARASAAVTGYNADAFDVSLFNLSGETPEGDWSVHLNGLDLELHYTPGAPDGTYESWIAGYDVDDKNAMTDDPDGDGMPNLIEYVTGGDPTDPTDGDKRPLFALDGDFIEFSHRRTTRSDYLEVSVEYSTTLADDWVTALHGEDGVAIATTFLDPETDLVTVRIPRTALPKLFARLRAGTTPP